MNIIFKGNGIVWNPKKGKPLCRFIDGVYSTDNHDEIAILRKSFETDSDLKEYDKKRSAVERAQKSRKKKVS